MNKIFFLILISIFFTCSEKMSQPETEETRLWHNQQRSVHYLPDEEDFVLQNGKMRFNRAIYGTNTAFRVEAGDLPEFSMYMPGMGGNLKFAIINGDRGKWLIDADSIETRYRPGSMIYKIKDSVLGDGELQLIVIAMGDAEGMMVKTSIKNIDDQVELMWVYGGVNGERFSRNGDIGADPESSFYLKPENCKGNEYQLNNNTFTVKYGQGSKHGEHFISGVFPENGGLHLADANQLSDPITCFQSEGDETPVVSGKLVTETDKDYFFSIFNSDSKSIFPYQESGSYFANAEKSRAEQANRIKIKTPDKYINTLGGALSVAADAIWEDPAYLHGAVAWRMQLAGWRGANVADPLGWHDRAETHFRAYAKSQLLEPASGPNVPDPEKNWARQKEEFGASLFTNGYLTRKPGKITTPHHYDMNLVFFDQLLSHFNWTGDTALVREMWPMIKRHLAWEKRCFDGNHDGLYDAYCCIWASDALQYSGGGVTHSSAYNYRANKLAAKLAEIIGEDPVQFHKEAEKILKSMNDKLWMPQYGWYAEYKDLLGKQLLHPAAAVWTIYHTIDSEVPDPFQAFQMLNYVDQEIPHIPIVAEGMDNEGYCTISTSSWQPYTWSVNNVALAEVLHTSLAYWQGGRSDDAFKLWKSALMESMYLSASPGGFQQLSFYDAMRGELYRDFADPIGMAGRTLVEGLFGITPDLMNNKLVIRPGLPSKWEFASLETPDILYDYKREKDQEIFTIKPKFSQDGTPLQLYVKARGESVNSLKVNGKEVEWVTEKEIVGEPVLVIDCKPAKEFHIEIEWGGEELERANVEPFYAQNETLNVSFNNAEIIDIYDPQKVLKTPIRKRNNLLAKVTGEEGLRTAFIKLQQGKFTWWSPIRFELRTPVEIVFSDEQSAAGETVIKIANHTAENIKGKLIVNPGNEEFTKDLEIYGKSVSEVISISEEHLKTGSSLVQFIWKDQIVKKPVINWSIQQKDQTFDEIDMTPYFNDKVTNIFKNRYESPRSPYPTLQLPLQGIGNWCYPTLDINIDDSGLRNLAGDDNKITLPQGISFGSPVDTLSDNIMFTSLWDNYPDEATVSLSGKASHIYFLLTGTTNPMQSRFENGSIVVEYADGTSEVLSLRNPETWYPIEQDYYTDGFAFYTGAPKPLRLHLKTGWIGTDFKDYVPIKGFTNYAIDGGAATVLDMVLDPGKELKQLVLKTTANDVIIGLMGVTLVRE